MGKKSVGRKTKNTWRVELRLNADDPIMQGLAKEAEARGLTLQQHITDLLIARGLQWRDPPQQPEQDPPPQDSASKLADEWM